MQKKEVLKTNKGLSHRIILYIVAVAYLPLYLYILNATAPKSVSRFTSVCFFYIVIDYNPFNTICLYVYIYILPPFFRYFKSAISADAILFSSSAKRILIIPPPYPVNIF